MLTVAALLALAPQNATQVALEKLRARDETVTTIGYNIATKGTALCPLHRAALPGLRVHVLGQYGSNDRADAKALFGLGVYPAILAIAPGSAADRAGLRAGDWIVSVNGGLTSARAHEPDDYALVTRFDAALAAALATPPARLGIVRDGRRSDVSITGDPGCASTVELVPSDELNAKADGRIVQITTGVLAEARSDDELAFVIAHEMAHNILRHRERLDRTGRSAAQIRATEIEADRLGVRLMHAAGYDPLAAARFWERFGNKTGAGIFSDGRHLRTKARVQLLRDEAKSLAQ